jgi:hypothetical protein
MEAQRRAVRRERLLNAPQCDKRNAKVVVRKRSVRIQLRRAMKVTPRVLPPRLRGGTAPLLDR